MERLLTCPRPGTQFPARGLRAAAYRVPTGAVLCLVSLHLTLPRDLNRNAAPFLSPGPPPLGGAGNLTTRTDQP